MATVEAVKSIVKPDLSNSLRAVWTPLIAANAVGDAFQSPGWAERSIQVHGTFDTGVLTMQGSNDGSNWFTLTDTEGAPLIFSEAGLRQTRQAPLYTRPLMTGASGTDSLTVTMIATR